MKTYAKLGFIILFIVIVAVVCTVAFNNLQSAVPTVVTESATSTAQMEEAVPDEANPQSVKYSISGDDLYVLENGKVVQTITLGEDIIEAKKVEIMTGDSLFIINQDANFDGHYDAAVLTGVGYGGVNYFYDYYVFSPLSKRLVKNDVLLQVGNPKIDSVNRRVISSFRSGPQWYSQVFQWNGSTYLKSEPEPEV